MRAKVGEEAKDSTPEGVQHRLLKLALFKVKGGLQESRYHVLAVKREDVGGLVDLKLVWVAFSGHFLNSCAQAEVAEQLTGGELDPEVLLEYEVEGQELVQVLLIALFGAAGDIDHIVGKLALLCASGRPLEARRYVDEGKQGLVDEKLVVRVRAEQSLGHEADAIVFLGVVYQHWVGRDEDLRDSLLDVDVGLDCKLVVLGSLFEDGFPQIEEKTNHVVDDQAWDQAELLGSVLNHATGLRTHGVSIASQQQQDLRYHMLEVHACSLALGQVHVTRLQKAAHIKQLVVLIECLPLR